MKIDKTSIVANSVGQGQSNRFMVHVLDGGYDGVSFIF